MRLVGHVIGGLVTSALQNFKSNASASPFGRRNRKTFSYFWVLIRASSSAIAIAGLYACCSSCRNPLPIGKDKLARATPTNDSKTPTHTPALFLALPSAPPLAPTPAATDSTVRYLKSNLQQIFKTVVEARPPAFALKVLVFLNGPCERSLKVSFPELYRGKTHIKYYNFIEQCEDYFATAKVKRPNRIPFAATFFWKQALFWWQQPKAKNADETKVRFTWEEFKAFFCQSLWELWTFVDSIWKTIRRDS